MIELTEHPIDTNAVLVGMSDPHCGAVVLFVGTTRQWTKPASEIGTEGDVGTSLETDHLRYDAYREMALKQMHALEETARRRWPVRQVTMVHRLGRVNPTEPSVVVAVSCPHRSEAFEAARWLIDELKHQVPIWKQEHYVQSGPQWIHPTAGNCSCHSSQKTEAVQSEAPQLQSNSSIRETAQSFANMDEEPVPPAEAAQQSPT